MGEVEIPTNVLQVTNISSTVTSDQIKHMLEYIGRVLDIRLFPEGENIDTNQTKVAYVTFEKPEHVEVSLHLTNTVMVDRALILVPYPDVNNIPDSANKALRVAAPSSTVAGMLPPTKEWSPNVVNMVCGTGATQTIQTLDAKLVELGLAQYPSLPSNTDPSKIEEIRRTIYVSNLDPGVNAEQLVQFFSQAGEVMFVRMAGDENLPSRNAYVEFTSQRSVPTALAYNGVLLSNRHVKVAHSLNAITSKPQTKAQEQLTKDIDEAMKKYKDVEHLIKDAAGANTRGPPRRRSRSRSTHRRRRRSRDRRRSRERKRSPSPHKSARRSSRERRRRSRSRDKKRSKSRERRRSRSRDKKRSRSPAKKRERERSKDRKRRSRSRDRTTSRRSRSRDRKDRDRRRRSTSRDRKRRRDKTPESKAKESGDVKVKRDYDAEEKETLLENEKDKSSQEDGDKASKDTENTKSDRENKEAGERKTNGTNGSESPDNSSSPKYKNGTSDDPMKSLEAAAIKSKPSSEQNGLESMDTGDNTP